MQQRAKTAEPQPEDNALTPIVELVCSQNYGQNHN